VDGVLRHSLAAGHLDDAREALAALEQVVADPAPPTDYSESLETVLHRHYPTLYQPASDMGAAAIRQEAIKRLENDQTVREKALLAAIAGLKREIADLNANPLRAVDDARIPRKWLDDICEGCSITCRSRRSRR
jgi:hypothetical protein